MRSFEERQEIAQTAFGVESSSYLSVLGLAILLAQVIGALKQLVVEPVRNLGLGIKQGCLFLMAIWQEHEITTYLVGAVVPRH